MKWLTLNISAKRVIGRSLSTEPSIQPAGDEFQGTASPVRGSFARSGAGEKTRGTLQLAALHCVSQRRDSIVATRTYTADQMSTFGAVT